MKRIILLITCFLFIITSSAYSDNLLSNIKELQRRKDAGEISQEEYKAILDVLLADKNSGANGSSVQQNAAPSNGIPVQVNILITRYWRAKDLVTLTSDLTMTVQGRRYEGQVFETEPDRMVMAFAAEVTPGDVHFKLNYRPGLHGTQRTFTFDFVERISQSAEITRVIDFIEVKNRDSAGSVADAKFLTQPEYTELLERRRNKEKGDTDIWNNIFKRK